MTLAAALYIHQIRRTQIPVAMFSCLQCFTFFGAYTGLFIRLLYSFHYYSHIHQVSHFLLKMIKVLYK